MKGVLNLAALIAIDGSVRLGDGATVEIRRESDDALPTLYSSAAGAAWTAGNPFTADSEGMFSVYLDGSPGGYKITITKGSSQRVLRNVPVGELQNYDLDDLPLLSDAELSAIAALVSAVDRGIYFTGPGTAALFTLTAFARTLLDDADQGTARTTLGVGTAQTPVFAQVQVAADPTTGLQVATKQYVDNLAAGFDVKPSVRLATTANDSLSGLAARDGVTPLAGERVLVKAQTAPAQNGIYVAAAGAWTRADDMSTWAEVPGAFVFVEEGTANADTGWVCTANNGGTLGTTAVTWSQFSGVGAYQPLDAELTAIAGLVSAADRLPYFTGSGAAALATFAAAARSLLALTAAADRLPYFDSATTAALATFTAAGRALIDDADAAAQRVTLQIVTSTAASALGPTAGAGASTQAARVDHVHQYPLEAIQIACSDETTNLTAGTAKVTFRMPYAFTVTDVRASLTAAQTAGSLLTVDVNENGVSILSTKLTFDNNEKTTVTAATQRVISDTALADDAEITVDIDVVGTAGAKGLKVTLIGRKA